MRKTIIAVAGSGKTSKICEIIKEAIKNNIPQEKIYAVTFTVTAASEIKNRLNTTHCNICTIHSLAYSVIINEKNVNHYSIYDAAFNTGYLEMLKQATEILNTNQNFYPLFLLVDEAQDLSEEEFLFINSIKTSNLVVVGDPLQSIMGFQGGHPKYMMSFKNMEIEKMDLSYRIPKNIADNINKIFTHSNIQSQKKDGTYNVLSVEPEQITNTVKNCLHKPGSSCVLYRTNNEIEFFARSLSNKKEYNYTIRLMQHPIIALSVLLLTMHDRINLENFSVSCNIIGYGGQRKNNLISAIKTAYRGKKINIEQLSLLTNNICDRNMPIIHAKSQILLSNIIDTLLTLEQSLDKENYLNENIVKGIKNLGYNVDNFWDIPDEALLKTITDFICGAKEKKYYIDNKSNKNLMTVHAAKGSEFNNVVVVVNDYFTKFKDPEEERIIYVAMTRAINDLTVIIPHSFQNENNQHSIIDTLLSTK